MDRDTSLVPERNAISTRYETRLSDFAVRCRISLWFSNLHTLGARRRNSWEDSTEASYRIHSLEQRDSNSGKRCNGTKVVRALL
jgi:hypothetical protein